MAEPTKLKTDAPKRKGWLKKLSIAAAVLAVLLVVAGFVVSSGAFFKGVIAPRIGAALNSQLTVADADISPFSQVVLRDVKLTPLGERVPLFTAHEIRARYSLMAILGGNIVVEEVALVSPNVTIMRRADGTSSLDPLLKSLQPSGPKTKSAPPRLDIKSVRISDGSFNPIEVPTAKDVRPTNSFGLYFNFNIHNIKNGSPGTMDFSSTILNSKREQTGTNFTALLGSEVKAQFSFDLAQDLQPTSVRGKGSYVVKEAKGEFAEFAAFAANLETEISPTEVKQLALRFSKSGAPLGEIRVSGPFDSAKSEGKLKAEILALDRHALNLLGAASGIDFGTTTVNGTSDIALTDGGAKISVAGSLDIARLQVTRAGQTSPALDLRCAYDVAVDSAAKSATLKAITLNGTQNQRALLRAELTSPMTVAWGSTAGAVGDSTFTVTVSDLGLADWRPFLGDTAPAGKLNAQTKIISKQGGKLLQIENATRVENLTVVAGGNRFANLSAEVSESVQATDLKQFKLTEYHAQVSQNGQAVVTIDATGAFDAEKQSTDADVKYLAAMPGLLQLARRPDLSASEGALAVTAHITQRGAAQAVTGNAQLVSFSGRAGQNIFRGYGAQVDFDIVKDGGRIGIKKAAGQLSEGAQAGGGFEANGSYDLGTGAGAVNLKLAGLNQNGLRPFLESALGGKKLVSVSLDSAAAASFAANGDSSVKADLKLANLVVRDPKSPKPDAPLEARAVVDASVAKNVATVRQCQLTLTPTQRAKNELNLSGSVDFSKPDAVTGTLKLAADSLDVTRYYDLFAAQPAAKPAPATTAPTTPSNPEVEPEAKSLPFRNFVFDASIGKLFLHEVEIANWLTTAKLDGGRVLLKPCQLVLNGAPVSADVDLDMGVPGWRYALAFSADKVPLAPLVNSFQPARKGQVGGTVNSSAKITGAGVTGAGFQKNLAGNFSLLATNMNLSIADVRSPLINSVINVVVGLPDLIRNPTALLGTLLGGRSGGGFADELTAKPIDVISARGVIGGGKVQIEESVVRSAVFVAEAPGEIQFAKVLANSPVHFPVRVALGRALAAKISLSTTDTPTNAAYVYLPDFLTMKGTLGKPETKINTLKLVGLAAGTGGGVVKQIGGAAGDKVGGILDLIGGLTGVRPAQQPAPDPAATNPAPAQPNAINILDLFGRPRN